MTDFFLYLIKVNVAIALFYGLYRLFFGGDTFFQVKRFALLLALVFSLLYPVVSLPEGWTSRSVWSELTTNNALSVYLDEVVVSAQAPEQGFSPAHLLGLLYLVGAGLLLIRMFIELTNVLLIIIRSRKVELGGCRIFVNENVDMPFSFFGCVVINPEKHTGEELREILLHETTHVRQWHSVDTVLCELLCIAFWFNPFMWLVRNEVRMNLEYLADKKVVDSGEDSRRYQFHLLRLTYTQAAAKLINNFNVSPLKQRIFMMNKKQTKHFGLMKYLLFIPAVAALFFFNQCTQKSEEAPQNEAVTIETADPDRVLEPEMAPKDGDPASTETRVYERAEKMPEFPEGDAALYQWLSENLQYPVKAAENKVQGTVTLRFVVTKTGEIGDVEILRGVDELLDAEALRVVKALPKFTPGMQRGEAVDVWFTLPIRFKTS